MRTRVKAWSSGLFVVLVVAAPAAAAPGIAIEPTPITFNNYPSPTEGGPPGVTQFGYFYVHNPGTTQLVVTDMKLTGPDASIVAFQWPCPETQRCKQKFKIAAADALFIPVKCTPAAAGTFTASLEIKSNAGYGPTTVAVSCIGNRPPIIEVSPGALDFGVAHSCWVGDSCADSCATRPLQQTVTITNTAAPPSVLDYTLDWSMNPLDFTTDTTMCALGCTLLAGQSQTFTIAFHPRNSGGPRDSTLTLVSQYPGQPPVQVPVSAYGGWGNFVFDTPSLLGAVPVGQTLTTTITGHSSGESCIQIVRASFLGVGFEQVGTYPQWLTLQAGEPFSWTVACTPHSVEGVYADGYLDITHENINWVMQQFSCMGLGGWLLAEPQQLFWGNDLAVPIGASATDRVTVRNAGNQPTDLTAITSTDPHFTATPVGAGVPITLVVGDTIDIDVTFTPTETARVFGEIAFAASNGDGYVMPVTGEGIAPGAIPLSVSNDVGGVASTSEGIGCHSGGPSTLPFAAGIAFWLARRRRKGPGALGGR